MDSRLSRAMLEALAEVPGCDEAEGWLLIRMPGVEPELGAVVVAEASIWSFAKRVSPPVKGSTGECQKLASSEV